MRVPGNFHVDLNLWCLPVESRRCEAEELPTSGDIIGVRTRRGGNVCVNAGGFRGGLQVECGIGPAQDQHAGEAAEFPAVVALPRTG